ncbi:MAG: hypothetical protein LBM05_00925 [Endomicrobium sp.]|jgi:hypothetical protein|nr:hypothetical protein [Endomicrobium sp.]
MHRLKQKYNHIHLILPDILRLANKLFDKENATKYIDLLITRLMKYIMSNEGYKIFDLTTVIPILLNSKQLINRHINRKLVLENLFLDLLQVCNEDIKKVIYDTLFSIEKDDYN